MRRGTEDLDPAVVLDERSEQRLYVRGIAREQRREDELVEDAGEAGRERAPRVTEPIARHQHAQQLDLAEDGIAHESRACRRVGEARRHALPRLARVIDQVEESCPSGLVEPRPERVLDERAQASRAVAQHVLQLLELAVHVADDVNGPARQREDRRQMRDLGERGRHVRQPIAESAEMRERGGRGRDHGRGPMVKCESPWG